MASRTSWPGGAPARPSSAHSIVIRKDGNAAADGDTLTVEQALRLVSCDTPESHYPTASSVKSATQKLATCKKRLENGDYDKLLPAELRSYLLKKLADPAKAAKQQLEGAEAAHKAFEQMLKKRLNQSGVKLRLGVLPAGEIIDSHGRMLAYLTPWFDSKKEDVPVRSSAKRRTFNLQMVAEGWAASFLIFGSLPSKKEDFDLVVKAARSAWRNRTGVWRLHGKQCMPGYEFRMCVKLGQPYKAKDGSRAAVTAKTLAADAFSRHCVDISEKRWRHLGLYDFWRVPPPERLWFWAKDDKTARKALDV